MLTMTLILKYSNTLAQYLTISRNFSGFLASTGGPTKVMYYLSCKLGSESPRSSHIKGIKIFFPEKLGYLKSKRREASLEETIAISVFPNNFAM